MRRLLVPIATLAGMASAQAAPEFPGGSFGSREGCVYARTGESSGADDFLLLNREGVTTSTALCSLEKIVPKGGSAYSLVFTCRTQGETGSDETGEATMKDDAWTVRLASGTVWGPIERCK